jgi:hypothetical protein
MADLDGAGGAKMFTISNSANVTIENLGGFGPGSTPVNAAELDTLAFSGESLTPPI